jgi:hypothetical protein
VSFFEALTCLHFLAILQSPSVLTFALLRENGDLEKGNWVAQALPILCFLQVLMNYYR